jgi:hypothetical protein
MLRAKLNKMPIGVPKGLNGEEKEILRILFSKEEAEFALKLSARGLEMFNHPDSWQAFSSPIVRNYADILAKERAGDSLFELKTDRVPTAVEKFLKDAQKLSEVSVVKNKLGETRMFTGKLAGEYTTLGSTVIHMILKRKQTL